MTTLLKTSRLAVAAVLVAGGVAVQAQTNTATTSTISTNQTQSNAVPAHPKVSTPTNGWKTSISFGFTIARGNTDTTLASATAMTEKRWLENDLVFGADGLYGETRSPGAPKLTENAETLHGFSQYNRFIADGFYGYMRVDGFHDGIADIKYRLALAPGLGYYFVTNKTMDLNGEIGPGYIREQLDGRTESFATLRIAEKLHYIISPHAKAWESVEFLPQVDRFDNFIVNAEVGVEAGLTRGNKLSLRTVVQDSYNNVPAADKLKNDVKLIASLAWKF